MFIMTITLEKIHEDIMELKRDLNKVKMIVSEDFELADDVVKEMQESRKRPKKDLISHEKMMNKYASK